MRLTLLFLLTLFTFLFAAAPAAVHAQSYLVQNAGIPAANGEYTAFSTFDGRVLYRKTPFNLYWCKGCAGGRWVIDTDFASYVPAQLIYYQANTGGATPSSQPWMTGSKGIAPAPTVTPVNLPVELVSFTARADGGAALLRWETISETNNAGFEVEHQLAGAWRPLGFVEGRGTTTEAQHYTYRADGLTPGTHTFRLRQVDYDGTFDYSPEVEVMIGVPGTHVLSDIYPNPFNPQASFTLSVATAQHVRLAVYDALGRQVTLVYDGQLDAGQTQRFTLDGDGLPSGMYVLRAQGETFQASRSLVLMK